MTSQSVTGGILSGSTNGRPIQVTGTSSGTADTVHTATNTTGEIDVLYIYATNRDSSAVTLSLWLGGTSTGDEVRQTIRPGDNVVVLGGHALRDGLVLMVSASTANVTSVYGRVSTLKAD